MICRRCIDARVYVWAACLELVSTFRLSRWRGDWFSSELLELLECFGVGECLKLLGFLGVGECLGFLGLLGFLEFFGSLGLLKLFKALKALQILQILRVFPRPQTRLKF